MTVKELADQRYGEEFSFTCGFHVGKIKFVFNCFDAIKDKHGSSTYSVSCQPRNRIRRESIEVDGGMNVFLPNSFLID